MNAVLAVPARLVAVLIMLGLGAACSGGDGGSPTGQGNGSVSIQLSAANATVTAGGSTTVTLMLTRAGDFTGAVNIAVQNLPSGVTATAAPTSIAAGANSAVITIQAGAGAAAGTATLTVRASGSGVSDATATLGLTVNAAQTGGFTLTLAPANATVQQGGSAQTTVNIARTAPFTGAIALTATGLPNGVTASFNPASAAGATSTLTLNVAAGAATGTHTITVRGTGPGVAEQTATLSLVVNAASSGGSVSWQFCAWDVAPVWFAVQDGNGAWTAVTGTNNAYTFDIGAARGAVAFVQPDGSGGFTTTVFLGLAGELEGMGTNRCAVPIGSKTVNGTVAGLGATEQSAIALGGAIAYVFPGSNTYTMQSVPDGPHDLIAARQQSTINGGTVTTTVDKLILRRGVDPANGSTLPVLDFGSAEAFDPVMSNVTVENLAGENAYVATWYETATGFVNVFSSDGSGTAATTRMWAGIPVDRQQSTDLHALQANAFAAGTDISTIRSVVHYFRVAADRTLTLGPLPGMATVTTIATAPYVRFRAQMAKQSEYSGIWGIGYVQGVGGGESRTIVMNMTESYTDGSATLDVSTPDFTGAAGWDASWGPRPGALTQWSVTGSGWTGSTGAGQSPVVEGGIVRIGSRVGQITP